MKGLQSGKCIIDKKYLESRYCSEGGSYHEYFTGGPLGNFVLLMNFIVFVGDVMAMLIGAYRRE